MYLPADLREHLKSLGLEPPPDNSQELTEWLAEVKKTAPEVYSLITRRAIQSVPETELEKAQRKARVMGAVRQAARRHLTKASAVGDKVPNVRLGLIVGIGALISVVLGVGLISGMRGKPAVQEAGGSPAAQRPAPAPSVARSPSPAPGPVISLPAEDRPVSQGSGPRQAVAGELIPPTARPVPSAAAVSPNPVPVPPPPSIQAVSAPAAQPSQQPQGVPVFEARRPQEAGRQAAPFVVEPQRETPREGGHGLPVVEAQRPSPSPSPQPADRGGGDGEDGEAGARQGGGGSGPLSSVTVGSVLEGVLQTGIVVYEGAAVPVLVRTGDILWVGAASLTGDRVQVALDRIVHSGRAFAVRAVALDGTDRSPGLSARVSTRGADVAQALVSGAMQGFSQYLQAVAQQGQTVVTNGSWAVVTQNQAGPWWAYVLSGVAGQVPSMAPRPQSQSVRVAEVRSGSKVHVLVLSAPEAQK